MTMTSTTPKNETPLPNGAPAPTAAAPTKTAASTSMVLGTDAYRGALEPGSSREAYEVAELMATAGQFNVKTGAEALAKVMYGRNLGIPAMQALQSLHSIEGKIGVAADMLQALCLKSPFCEYFEPVLAECDATKATFVTRRIGRPEQKYTYTLEDAEAMGVIDRGKDEEAKKKNNWNRVRKQMLQARCKAILAKLIYPDVTQGLHSTEELEAMREGIAPDPDELVGEIVPAAIADAVTTVHAAKRDYGKEAEELKVKIRAAGTSRQAAVEIREAIKAWDGVEPYKAQVEAFYNEVREERKRAAAAAEAAPATSVERPGPMPEGNLFSKPTDANGEGK